MTVTGSPLIYDDYVVLVSITALDKQGRRFGRRFTRSAGHVEDGALVRMRVARRNENDLQWQHAAFSSLAVLEHFVDAAAQLLLYALEVAGRQRHMGCSRYGRREIELRERCAEYCGATQRDRDQRPHGKSLMARSSFHRTRRKSPSSILENFRFPRCSC